MNEATRKLQKKTSSRASKKTTRTGIFCKSFQLDGNTSILIVHYSVTTSELISSAYIFTLRRHVLKILVSAQSNFVIYYKQCGCENEGGHCRTQGLLSVCSV